MVKKKKILPVMQIWVRSLSQKILRWRKRQPTPVFSPGESPPTEEPGRPQSQKAGHHWGAIVTSTGLPLLVPPLPLDRCFRFRSRRDGARPRREELGIVGALSFLAPRPSWRLLLVSGLLRAEVLAARGAQGVAGLELRIVNFLSCPLCSRLGASRI